MKRKVNDGQFRIVFFPARLHRKKEAANLHGQLNNKQLYLVVLVQSASERKEKERERMRGNAKEWALQSGPQISR